jgi:hypothetical protein
MATQSKIGTLRFEVDGEWDMQDLREVSESLYEAYGLFYPLVADDDDVRARLQDSLRQTFWSGNVNSRFIGDRLYRQIPRQETLLLKSFHYSSQGAMTVAGVLSVLAMMAYVARAWITTSDKAFDLYKKLRSFLGSESIYRGLEGNLSSMRKWLSIATKRARWSMRLAVLWVSLPTCARRLSLR